MVFTRSQLKKVSITSEMREYFENLMKPLGRGFICFRFQLKPSTTRRVTNFIVICRLVCH